MKACLLIAPGRVELADVPVPEPGPGEVLIRVKAALTCGTDLKAFRRGHPMIPMPSIFGHEYSGIVETVGDGIEGFKPGTAVMGVHSAPCGSCFFCRRSEHQLCESLMESKVLGTFAEYLRLPPRVVRQNLFEKPDALSFQEAAFLEPLACVVHGIRKGELENSSRVVVIGAGPIGLLHLLVLKFMGKEVLVAGRRTARLHAATRLGADRVVDTEAVSDVGSEIRDWTDGYGADTVIECTGQASVWEEAVGYTRRGGTLVLFGGCPSGTRVSYDAGRIHYDAIRLMGVFHFSPSDVEDARKLLMHRHVNVRPLISGSYPLEELGLAMERLARGDGIKFAILPGEG